MPLKASAEFAAITARLLSELPLDTWQEDELHFFVFWLRPHGDAGSEPEAASEPPVAVFVMHPASAAPVSAVVVTPRPDRAEPEVHDLRLSEQSTMDG